MLNATGKLLALVLFVSYSAQARGSEVNTSDEVCTNLEELTCAPGSYDDGTGVATTPTSINSTKDKVSAEIRSEILSKFKEALSNFNNQPFTELAQKALGLDNSPACQSSKTGNECLAQITEGLANISYNTLVAPDAGRNSHLDAQALNELLNAPAFIKVQNALAESLHQKAVDDGSLNRIKNDIFPKVKKLLIKKINEFVTDEDAKKLFVQRVSTMQIEDAGCSGTTMYGYTSLPQLLSSQAQYIGPKNTVRIYCGLATPNFSEFEMVNIMAHEMTHSFSPCGATQGAPGTTINYPKVGTEEAIESEYPIHVVSCLRGEKSLQVKNWMLELAKNAQSLPISNYTTPQGTSNPQKSKLPQFSFCGEDQINEGLPDWMGVEVLTDYMKENHKNLTPEQFRIGYANVWRFGCLDIETPHSPLSPPNHPNFNLRINSLLLVHPKVRAQMHCSATHPTYEYCSATGVSSRPQNKPGGVSK